MGLDVNYHPHVLSHDIPDLSKTIRTRIKKAIEKKLCSHPEIFGEPLRGSLVPLWKLRVGDYRIVYDFKGVTVYIHAIGHRKHIYTRIAPKRTRLED
ncbi:type II toxin-antitoxin system RelE/ParE family toxin [Candidatus Kaiserbacteria bacterium]|nr:type II toxin-antitoxin system RelE/ParE family toxin [Candidatus Kaiserbacteria bacterium]